MAVADGVIDDDEKAIENYALGLRLVVALSVGAALLLGVLRILKNWSLPLMIIGGYILVVVVTTIAPLVTALGVGLASSLKGRNPMTDGFGLIAFASLTPILFVLVYGIITQWT